ncbi:NAD(P)H dehydrogenase (quinone) [Loktanella sp. PT4BL]|uniref:SDR family oxidoreductase n=1 Tax=Loktanella sp. PT4BL TaxID=2135611 RepID=UPI000D7640FA|nr:SDR family oxidoreductase [Loktanella sp. PT4BL]PXW68827.1 NAD(P)H dehydrogenase (quinone) [Loktanella sp. PT4BL]
MSTFLITGASGQLGQQTISRLAQRTDAANIVALVRTDAQAADFADRGIATRKGDYNDQAGLEAAFEGIDRMLFVSGSDIANRMPQHKAIVAAAKAAGIGYIAYTSLLDAAESPLALAADHKATEALIADSGIAYTFLRNAWYSENMLMSLEQDLNMGQHFGAAGDGKFSFSSRGDLAEAAAIALLGGYDGETLELGGDEALSMADYCAILSEVAGKTVTYVDMPAQAYQEALQSAGLPPEFASFLAITDAQAAHGALQDDSKTLSKMLGRPTVTMADVLRKALQK